MSDGNIPPVLAGQKALVIGVANDKSIAYGCAKAFRTAGADLAITWLNEKARVYVEPLAEDLEASVTGAVDVSVPGELEAIFDLIRTKWGRLEILVHSIAFAPKDDLQGGLLNCSAEGFVKAMDISCHSFVRMAKLAAPLMRDGGTMFAMSYHGANRVVPNYNVMGPVKAALEAACRYLAYELGPSGIRVHAISPGPLKTRAASGLKDFELLLNEAANKAPLGELVDIMDVGFACGYLATSLARRLRADIVYVDGGTNIIADLHSIASRLSTPVPPASSSRSMRRPVRPICCFVARWRASASLRICASPTPRVMLSPTRPGLPEGFDHVASNARDPQDGRQLIGDARVIGIGHRVVHGGGRPARGAVERPCPCSAVGADPPWPAASAAQPRADQGDRRSGAQIPQIACFDTAFHRSQDHLAQSFALPRWLTDEGVRRYGFHGSRTIPSGPAGDA